MPAGWCLEKGQDMDKTATHRWRHGSEGEEEEQVERGHLSLIICIQAVTITHAGLIKSVIKLTNFPCNKCLIINIYPGIPGSRDAKQRESHRRGFYLLISPILWLEITAGLLKSEVEVGESVEQVHPPWWRVANHRCHGEWTSMRCAQQTNRL